MNRHWYVYVVVNRQNGKEYVGKAWDPASRWKQHVWSALRRKTTSRLHDAIRKYGAESFALSVICGFANERDCLEFECDLIRQRNSMIEGYNITHGGDGVAGLPEATRLARGRKVSEALKGRPISQKQKDAIRAWHTGRKRPPETCEAISMAKRGKPMTDAQMRAAAAAQAAWRGRHHSEAAKARIGAAQRDRPILPGGHKLSIESRRKISATKSPKLSDADVVAIRHACVAGETRQALAIRYGVDLSLISQIAIGKARTLAGGPIAGKRSQNGRTDITDETRTMVRELTASGLSTRRVGEACGISCASVSKILRGLA